MKNEDIYNGITEIEDELIDGAARGMKRRRKLSWLPAAAAAVLALTVGAAFLWPRNAGPSADDPTPPTQSQPSGPVDTPPTPVLPDDSGDEPTQPTSPSPSGGEDDPFPTPTAFLPTPDLPFAVSLAAYPNQPKYSEHSSDEYDLWSDARWARLKLARAYDGSGDDFFTRSMAQFLSDSGGENRTISPLNLYMALSMLAETSGGESRAQLLDLLGTEDLEALRAQVFRLWNGTYQDDGMAVTILSNSLWMNQDADYIRETTDILAKDYYASSFQGEMGSEEYNQALRDWLNLQTGGLLEEQAAGAQLHPDTVLALVSTIYYRAKWLDPFDAEDTSPGTFHTPTGDVTCDFMHQYGWGWLYRGENFSAVSKSLSQSGNMWFLLPDEGTDVDELLSGPQLSDFLTNIQDHWDESCELFFINSSIPKFDVASDLDLKDGLAALGVTDVFDPAADFSPLLEDPEGVCVSQAAHAARVAIDEEGCTAAAFADMDYGMGGPEDDIDFTLDRPFLFLLISDTDIPLFAGIVNQP